MPYANPEKQKASQHAFYLRNKSKVYKQSKKRVREVQLWIQQLKESKPCMDCNRFLPYYMMHFDHIKKKSFHICNAHMKYGKDKIEQEIAKCELVCSNCHAARTHLRSEDDYR